MNERTVGDRRKKPPVGPELVFFSKRRHWGKAFRRLVRTKTFHFGLLALCLAAGMALYFVL